MKTLSTHNRDAQRVIGLVGSLTMLGFACSEGAESGGTFLFALDEGAVVPAASAYLLFAVLFAASAVFISRNVIQVALFFSLSALQSGQADALHFGLGFAVVSAMILLRQGWFFHGPMIKAAVVSGVGGFTLVLPPLASGARGRALLPALIWAVAYVIIVFGLARGRYLSALAPRKRVLRLADFHLTDREKRVVKLRIAGKSAKEIAAENNIALSTVRNVLSLSYHKLGIAGGEALMAIGERYTVE
jgi:DNA-binding CsgD family transcriptional regulator